MPNNSLYVEFFKACGATCTPMNFSEVYNALQLKTLDGSLFTTSILSRDYTLIMGITVFFAVFLVVCTLIVDILYVFVDPRIKYD